VRYLEQRRVVFANLDVAQLSIDRCELAISDFELADAPHRDSLSAEPQEPTVRPSGESWFTANSVVDRPSTFVCLIG
jgi:hypothetical protein